MTDTKFELLPELNERDRAIKYVRDLMDEFTVQKKNDDVKELREVYRLLQTKRYGIVWEEHAENVDEEMKSSVPVFIDEKARTINFNKDSDAYDFLIEGDNLHTLHLLQKTHLGKIDFIYIDPPYNTGNKSFKYNDEFVSADDAYVHSKWISFMNRRMKLAKNLLTTDGVMFISIDNNEYANLKMLMDEIMPSGYVTTIHIQMSATQGMKVKSAKSGNIVKNGEYILVYSRSGNKQIMKHPLTNRTEYDGHYNKFLRVRDDNSYTEHKLADVISENKNLVDELTLLGLVREGKKLSNSKISEYYEKSDAVRAFINENAENIVRDHTGIDVGDTNKYEIGIVYKYQSQDRSYLIFKNAKGVVTQRIRFSDKLGWSDDFKSEYGPLTIRGDWWKDFYLDMGNVSREGGVKLDNGKKPLRLLKQLIKATTDSDALILDFFAGSGTTGHAVAELNREEGSHRHFIMATDDEVVEIAYQRMLNISHDTGLNLKYFKTDFVPYASPNIERDLLMNVKTLVELERGIDSDNPKIAFVFDRTDFADVQLTNVDTVYIRTRVHDMMSNEELLNMQDNNIELIDVPDRYFASELRGNE